jgi:hypothetical protein
MSEFDRNLGHPIPEVVDMMTWLRDQRAKSVNGDARGRGAMRHGGREIILYKNEMKDAKIYFDFEDLKPSGTNPQSLLDRSENAKRAAQGFNETQFNDGTDNDEIRAIEWFTHFNGNKVIVTVADNFKKIIRYTELKDKDGKPRKTWPIVDRVMYPMAKDWDGVSIPDLIEDKQRARSVIQNSALNTVKVGQETMYLYDANRIKNRGNLELKFNKHIPVNGSPVGAIQEIQRAQVKSDVQWILDTLDYAAQKASATPDIQQGASSGAQKTATETSILSDKVDTRYSLTAKIWGWSERRFWQLWYELYKTYFVDKIDEKIIRLIGPLGPTFKKLTRENFILKTDPDVFVESRAVTETQNINKLQKFRLWVKDIAATMPQEANLRFALKSIAELSDIKKDLIDRILPPSMDELDAEEENQLLSAGKIADIDVADDDFVHMEIHNRASDTPQKFAHMKAHRDAMLLKRKNPELDLNKNRLMQPDEQANNGAPLLRPTPLPKTYG